MPPRKQNKSCDECRRLRVGCDAHIFSSATCSNCKRRGKPCTTNWLTKREEVRGRRSQQQAAIVPSERPRDLLNHNTNNQADESQALRNEQALRLHHALWETFITLFEPQLGLWIGNDCNPFTRITTAPKTLVSRLMVTLDSTRDAAQPDPLICDMLRLPANSSHTLAQSKDCDARINQALMSAVHAFSARWLPISLFKKAGQPDELARKRVMQVLWEQAHRHVLPILTLPSYRSILALYLFAITPSVTSTHMQAVSQLCYETSLRHYLQLRLESRISSSPQAAMTLGHQELSHLEDSAYWFGLVCDVSRSLLRCQPPILLSGPSSQARVWSLVSSQVDEFALQSANIRYSADVLEDDSVLRILQLGSSCKTMCWASITDVQDALFYNRSSVGMQDALSYALTKLHQFEVVFSPLLEHIARDFVLLSEKSQLGYMWLVIHFQLGVLILADSLTAGSARLTPEDEVSIATRRLGSVRAIVNVINLVRQFDNLNNQHSSLLLRDPYPEHASNALSRAGKAVVNLSKDGSITLSAAGVLATAIMQGLGIVSWISLSATHSLVDLTALFQSNGIHLHLPLERLDVAATSSTSISLESAVTPEMLGNDTIRELGQQAVADPSLVEKTIERHEVLAVGSTPDFNLDYLQFIDFTAVAGDWDFEDVFANG